MTFRPTNTAEINTENRLKIVKVATSFDPVFSKFKTGRIVFPFVETLLHNGGKKDVNERRTNTASSFWFLM
ncbi:16759_t:CDS:2 [Acaulospora colombiana]|uniref:16759_t:CDS:1 n=1 Tax=Acaulospora colombiana TaxID=27376 RepID=A0ACA9KES7_9GLOM|nr:16759_t:CDS:2 [Acaulospora colombiana]